MGFVYVAPFELAVAVDDPTAAEAELAGLDEATADTEELEAPLFQLVQELWAATAPMKDNNTIGLYIMIVSFARL